MLFSSELCRYGAAVLLFCVLTLGTDSYPLSYNVPWKRAPHRQLTWQDLLSAPQYKRYSLNALLDEPQYQDYADYYSDLPNSQRMYPSLLNDLNPNYDDLTPDNLPLYESLLPYLSPDDVMYDGEQLPYAYQNDDTREQPTVWYDSSFDIPEQEEIGLDDGFMQDDLNDYNRYQPAGLSAESVNKFLPEDDEAVFELQSLAHPHKKNTVPTSTFNNVRKPESLPISDRKSASTVAPPSTIASPKEKPSVPTTSATFTQQGQKEVPLLRPATPVKQPFPLPAFQEVDKTEENGQKKSQFQSTRNTKSKTSEVKEQRPQRSGESVYDTIKRLLAMEKKLQEAEETEAKVADTDLHQHKKRFVSNEESLVNELDNLKRVMA